MNRLQPDPFEDGYNIAELYREREHRDDEVALAYAWFCRSRQLALSVKNKKNDWELCDICFFHKDKSKLFLKKKVGISSCSIETE